MDIDKLLEQLPKRDILQIVPAQDWEAVFTSWDGNDLEILSGRIQSSALVEEQQPRMSMVVGVIKYFVDELPGFHGYTHKSVPVDQVNPGPPGLPLRVLDRSLRELRSAGQIVTSKYPTFEAIHDPFSPRLNQIVNSLSPVSIDVENLPPEDRRIVGIMPATGATALFSTINGATERQPIFVWALVQERDGSYTVGGIDKERFLCDEWTNFVGYEPEPPKPDDCQWGGGFRKHALKLM
jgi:hypothetical protein